MGGIPVNPTEYSFVVSIQAVRTVNLQPFRCAGTLITPLHVLTAAHCVEMYSPDGNLTNYDAGDITVFIGWADLSNNSAFLDERAEMTNAAVVTLHPAYTINVTSRATTNDLAIVTLLKASNFPPVAMDFSGQRIGVGYAAQAVGYGWTGVTNSVRSEASPEANSMPYGSVAYGAQVPIVNDSFCMSLYPRSYVPKTSNICAGSLNGGVDFCKCGALPPLPASPLLCRWQHSHRLGSLLEYSIVYLK